MCETAVGVFVSVGTRSGQNVLGYKRSL
jgi:hypothetical protein